MAIGVLVIGVAVGADARSAARLGVAAGAGSARRRPDRGGARGGSPTWRDGADVGLATRRELIVDARHRRPVWSTDAEQPRARRPVRPDGPGLTVRWHASPSSSPAARSARCSIRSPAATCRCSMARRSSPARRASTTIAEVVAIDRGRTGREPLHVPAAARARGRAPRRARRSGDRRRGRGPGHGHDRGDELLLGPAPRRAEAGGRDRRDAGLGRARVRRAGQPARRGPGGRRARACAGRASSVSLAGTIEPADDVQKMHATALDTFRSPNGGSLGRVGGPRRRASRGRAGRAATSRPTAPELRLPRSPRPWPRTRSCSTRRSPPARTGSWWPPPGPGTPIRRCSPRPNGRWPPGIPVALASRCPGGRATAGYAFPGGGANWLRAGALPVGHLCALKARVALALGHRRRAGPRRADGAAGRPVG